MKPPRVEDAPERAKHAKEVELSLLRNEYKVDRPFFAPDCFKKEMASTTSKASKKAKGKGKAAPTQQELQTFKGKPTDTPSASAGTGNLLGFLGSETGIMAGKAKGSDKARKQKKPGSPKRINRAQN